MADESNPCILEATADLHPTNWLTINAPTTVVVTNAHVELATPAGAKFYRLRLP